MESKSSGYLTSGVQFSSLSLQLSFVKGYRMVLALFEELMEKFETTSLVKVVWKEGSCPARGDKQQRA